MAVGRARGKLILCGEHAVVHGHPAIALAVDRHTEVRLRRRPGPTAIDGGPTDERLARALAVALPPSGIGVTLRTELPLGRGLGSSASLAVALVRAAADLEGESLSHDVLFERAFAIERVFHGRPSGVDHATAAREGALYYRPGPPPVFRPLPSPRGRFVVLDSGASGDTAELVAGVAARRPGIDDALARIGALVDEAAEALDAPHVLGPLLSENHALLRRIGVSTPDLDALVELALDHGALGAKLSGAGGGGVVLALVTDPTALLAAASARDIPAFAFGGDP